MHSAENRPRAHVSYDTIGLRAHIARNVVIYIRNQRGVGNGNWTEWSTIHNGNRTEWSPIRSVIIRAINKIGRPRSGSPICLITSMITDRIG